MKRSLSLLLALCLLLTVSAALALTDAERATLVGSYLPADAVFLREEADDGVTELKYETADKTAEYEIKMDDSGSRVAKVSYELLGGVGGATQALSDTQAFAVIQKLYPDATLAAVTPDTDDGRFETKVAFSTPALTGEYKLNAEDGTVIEYELYPHAEAKTDEAVALELLQAQHAGATIVTVEKDMDDGRAEYEGKASLDGQVYEFSIDIASGKVTEWKLDD